ELLSTDDEEELERLAKKDKLMEEVVKDMKEFSSEEWVQDYNSKDRLIESQHETEMKEQTISIAKSMLEEKCDISLINKVTNLSIEEIEALAKELN
ncbi:MAG: hypothetical protein NC483_06125, partial [Ruminococcus sp.]|nr:hypothetical protein [Ruminococcus sp.]